MDKAMHRLTSQIGKIQKNTEELGFIIDELDKFRDKSKMGKEKKKVQEEISWNLEALEAIKETIKMLEEENNIRKQWLEGIPDVGNMTIEDLM